MPSLLALPRELRDNIWELACHNEFPPDPPYGVTKHHLSKPSKSSKPFKPSHGHTHRLLRTNRQIYNEVTPYMYETTIVRISHPYEAPRWIRCIGTRNSFCIRHLVLGFTSLSLETPRTKAEASERWTASLRLLPNLQSLTFNYEPDENCKEPWAEVQEELPIHHAPPREDLATLPEPENIKLQRNRNYDPEIRDLQPDHRFQSITHAVLAIHEPIPSMLVLYFAKLLKLSSATSLEQSITCLPAGFFPSLSFHPTRAYALTEGPPSMVFTYRKLDVVPLQWPIGSAPNLNLLLSQLPRLSYLRLGCRQVDSAILTAIPPGIKTLDIAFADPDPARVGANLKAMRVRCPQLFTLTIAISPLHDHSWPLSLVREEDHVEHDGEVWWTEEQEAARMALWAPFWEALEWVQRTGVRVWEGEGDGFRRFTGRDEGGSGGGGGGGGVQFL